jgi:hypothetical protein
VRASRNGAALELRSEPIALETLLVVDAPFASLQLVVMAGFGRSLKLTLRAGRLRGACVVRSSSRCARLGPASVEEKLTWLSHLRVWVERALTVEADLHRSTSAASGRCVRARPSVRAASTHARSA